MNVLTFVTDPNIEQYYPVSSLPDSLTCLKTKPDYPYQTSLSDEDESMIFLKNSDIYNWLAQKLTKSKKYIKRLANGLLKIDFISEQPHPTDLTELIDILSYKELYIALPASDNINIAVKYDPTIEYENIHQHSVSTTNAHHDWLNIIKHIISTELNIPIESLIYNGVVANTGNNPSVVTGSDLIRYQVLSGADSIWVSNLDYVRINNLDLLSYYGWRYLTDSPLIFQIFNELQTVVPVRQVYDFYIIPFIIDYANNIPFLDKLSYFINKGYQTVDIPDSTIKSTDGRLSMYYEILTRFGYKIIMKPELSDTTYLKRPLVVCNNLILHNNSLSAWLSDSVGLIINNQLPYVVISHDFNFQQIQYGKYIVKYLAVLAYHNLIKIYPYLKSAIYNLDVFEDFSIKLQVSKLEEVEKFKQLMSDIINDIDIYSWQVELVPTLKSVVERRLWLSDQNIFNLSFTHDNKYIIVSEITNNVNKKIKLKQSLSLNTEINADIDLISSITDLSYNLMYQYGLLGWFTVKIDSQTITGLFNQPPLKYTYPIKYGKISVESIINNNLGEEDQNLLLLEVKVNINTNDQVCLSVLNGEINSFDLFQIALTRSTGGALTVAEIEMMKDISRNLEWIWQNGWFLSVWATAIMYGIQNDLIPCSSNSYNYPSDYILSNAHSNPENGTKALRYINLLSQNYQN